jgi:hypothetical protein
LGERSVGHPESVKETFPEFEGVGGGEGTAGGKEGLKGFEGGGAKDAICKNVLVRSLGIVIEKNWLRKTYHSRRGS